MTGSEQGYSPDMIIQYSLVGLALLAACCWIIWKLVKKNKSKDSNGCCGCALEDSCNKKRRENGNIKDLQRQHSRKSDRSHC
ncbi:MAG: FeoB-associated Cys-rich membrane protein [Muribaculaceae bacterium]|nr:FeoB-associated Cys-rich membrane protein [Muribaculaceae bacterium]